MFSGIGFIVAVVCWLMVLSMACLLFMAFFAAIQFTSKHRSLKFTVHHQKKKTMKCLTTSLELRRSFDVADRPWCNFGYRGDRTVAVAQNLIFGAFYTLLRTWGGSKTPRHLEGNLNRRNAQRYSERPHQQNSS